MHTADHVPINDDSIHEARSLSKFVSMANDVSEILFHGHFAWPGVTVEPGRTANVLYARAPSGVVALIMFGANWNKLERRIHI
jgi:hypothetical protein